MAGFSWSNPDQSDATAAKLQGSYRPEQVQIGSIVAALLKQKHDEEELKRQQTQDLIKGIGSVAVGAEKGYQSGQADDAANAAMYGAQYPNDPYGGYQNPDVVPDYGGQDALKTDLIRQKLSGDPLKNELTQARTNAANALADRRWSGGSTGGTSGYDQSQPETVIDEQGREWRRGSGGQWFPMFSAAHAYRSSLNGKNAPTMDTQTIYPDDGTPDAPVAPVDPQLPPNTAVPAGGKGAGSVSSNDVNQVQQAPGNDGLRQEAMDAINRGAPADAVKARYKQLTGQDL
jgi:hypothetical protein